MTNLKIYEPGRTVVGKDQVQIYRPPVSREDVRGQKPSPGTIVTRENIKPVSERTKGDLTRTNSNTNQRTGNEQMPPANNSVPPKYKRTDKFNQNNNHREQSNQKRIGAPIQKTQPVQDRKTNPSNRKVSESKQNTDSAPAKTNKGESPNRRGN